MDPRPSLKPTLKLTLKPLRVKGRVKFTIATPPPRHSPTPSLSRPSLDETFRHVALGKDRDNFSGSRLPFILTQLLDQLGH